MAGRYIPPVYSKHVRQRTVTRGHDEATRHRYYAFVKHRSQAHYRNESYELTFEDWLELWPRHLWTQRGRGADDLCLTRWDFNGEWSRVNVKVCTRREHFAIKKGMPITHGR